MALATVISGDAVSWVTAVRSFTGSKWQLAVERGTQCQRADGLQNAVTIASADLATLSEPMLPAAPPRLSTMTGWPACADTF